MLLSGLGVLKTQDAQPVSGLVHIQAAEVQAGDQLWANDLVDMND